MMPWALVFAADMVAGLGAREKKRRRIMVAMVGECVEFVVEVVLQGERRVV